MDVVNQTALRMPDPFGGSVGCGEVLRVRATNGAKRWWQNDGGKTMVAKRWGQNDGGIDRAMGPIGHVGLMGPMGPIGPVECRPLHRRGWSKRQRESG